jgi:hypothetical protein
MSLILIMIVILMVIEMIIINKNNEYIINKNKISFFHEVKLHLIFILIFHSRFHPIRLISQTSTKWNTISLPFQPFYFFTVKHHLKDRKSNMPPGF